MSDRCKGFLLRLLRVPPRPEPPEGSTGSIRIFNAGRNYFRWRIVRWSFGHFWIVMAVLALVILPPPARAAPGWLVTAWHWFEGLTIAGYAAFLPLSYFKQRLDYEMRWYIVTDRSLRIRSGIWSVEELTMTFANIQDIRVKAGPLQYFLGLADVEVRTAGGSAVGPGSTGHIAHFRGVDNAAEIRDLMVERLRIYRDAGLGDQTVPEPAHRGALAAAREVLKAARSVREFLAS